METYQPSGELWQDHTQCTDLRQPGVYVGIFRANRSSHTPREMTRVVDGKVACKYDGKSPICQQAKPGVQAVNHIVWKAQRGTYRSYEDARTRGQAGMDKRYQVMCEKLSQTLQPTGK